MRALTLIVVVCLAACGDNKAARDDAGVQDAAPDGAQGLKHCLDNPTSLVAPPNGRLPCDMLPPGFGP